LTDAEVMDLLRGETPWNKARREFQNWAGKIDQSCSQGASPIEIRRMEFEAVKAIALAMLKGQQK
jgi:hypothetical protein